MLNSIVTTLQQLIELQKQLISISDQKKAVLIERKVDELNRLVKEEAKLVKQLDELETEREQQVESVLQKHPTLTFSQVIDQSSEETKLSLQNHMKNLQELLLELQAKNQLNERLLADSMNFVQHMIEQVTKSKQQQFNYQSPLGQQKTQTSSRGFFDTKA